MKIQLNKSTRVTKNTDGDYVLQAVPENMDLLMRKINELVDEVESLKLQIMMLERTKAKKQLICGPKY